VSESDLVIDPADGWSRLHQGIDPRGNRMLWCWLQLMWWLAGPLARLRVRPLVVTVTGAALALAAAVLGSGWVALILILGSVVGDGLDGAVALLGGRASKFGARADKVADRIADVAFVVVLWRCGAWWPLTVVAGLGMVGVEAYREIAGGRLRAMITVAERPSRVVCAVLACGCAGFSAATWPATVCAGVLLGLSAVGLAQLRAAGRASSASRADADGGTAR
jgi:phosphatidylglycerophosphate synthase